MTALKAKDVEDALAIKGFEVVQGKHREFRLMVEGQRTSVATHTSHNSQEIDDFLASMMARQLHLPKADFHRLVGCSLSGEEYLKRMVAEGWVVLASAPPAPSKATKPRRKGR
ncbi:MAG: hypothetical protein HY909_03460 [Deltaproteobacteria bacterium]|nr:hypothetical protein [Deltaproteobacteria bacterium]